MLRFRKRELSNPAVSPHCLTGQALHFVCVSAHRPKAQRVVPTSRQFPISLIGMWLLESRGRFPHSDNLVSRDESGHGEVRGLHSHPPAPNITARFSPSFHKDSQPDCPHLVPTTSLICPHNQLIFEYLRSLAIIRRTVTRER